MMRICLVSLAAMLLGTVAPVRADEPPDARQWTVYVANDNCPDYTWGLTEEQTRQAFADVVRGHLDEMKRTDGQPSESRDRYNMAVTQEAICFVEKYPERKQELIDRIKEGRVYVSPYLCNSLWGMQSAEGVLRTFYPARRLEREWGVPLTTAHHIEEPSLPWGTATLLAGCGIRHLTNPYYGYDSTFGDLKCPPLFYLEGPDGSRIKVWLDRFASSKSHYTQGAAMLRKPDAIEKEWIAHYAGLGAVYPLRSILASGTHGDISPGSGGQARRVRRGDHPLQRAAGRPSAAGQCDLPDVLAGGRGGRSQAAVPAGRARLLRAQLGRLAGVAGEVRRRHARGRAAVAGRGNAAGRRGRRAARMRPRRCADSVSAPSGAGPCFRITPGTAPTSGTNATMPTCASDGARS